jgi:hypothetical protein
MVPLIPTELLSTVVETVCYFCTAVAVVVGLLLAPRG